MAVRNGIEAATVRAVAAEAGVSLGVVHYCFEDKTELLRELGRSITADAVAHVDFGANAAPDARTAVGTALASIWDAMRANRSAQLLSVELTTTGLRHEELRGVATGQLENARRAAREVLVQAAAAAGVRWTVPVESLALLTVVALRGVALVWLVDGDEPAARSALGLVADQIAAQCEPVPVGPGPVLVTPRPPSDRAAVEASAD